MIMSIYAAYRGDRYIGEGTLSELAKVLKVKRQTLVWARYPAARKASRRPRRIRSSRARAASTSCWWKSAEGGESRNV
ncbi:hypothetical protein [Mitsuokella multacida]|uniref:hypothetical protein n=1 Tax=Mitsuokella multacida TaxID=52226 RepID=UPI0026DCBD7E|nr:hypothetical protein [Mitsuokella multacida]